MKYILCLVLILKSWSVFAHQPVMDMAPRWEDGYGFQTRLERFDNQTTTWLEGVYTFKPSVRLTFKLPHMDGGDMGDAIIGIPLKKYTNKGALTYNWSFTPSIRLPTGSGSDDSDLGLSFSYSSETPEYYQLYDLYAWEDRVGVDINVGIHPIHNNDNNSGLFTMWDVSLLTSDDGDRIQTGPVIVYYWQNFMLRAEYKDLVYEHNNLSDGAYTSLGVGVTF